MNIASTQNQPANRQTIGFTVGHTMSQQGETLRDLYTGLDNTAGVDHDDRQGFVDLADPHKFFDKAEIGSNDQGVVTSLKLTNTWGMHPSQDWTFDQNGSPETLTVNNPTYAKKDQTVYHFDFAPDVQPWMEHIYETA